MSKVQSVLLPIAPHLSHELEEFHIPTITLDEWLEIEDGIVGDEIVEGVEKMRIESSKLVRTVLSGLNLDKCEMSDVVMEKVEATTFRTYRASWHRVVFLDVRATGADFAESYFEDCLFKNVKFDEAGFRMAQFKRVHFENCVLNKADFYQAKFHNVSFSNCELELTNFDKATCHLVDFRGENLSLIKGVLGLKGVRISQEQLIQIAPLFAGELGFVIND